MIARSATLLVAALFVSTAASATSYADLIPVKQRGSGPFYRIKRGGSWGYVDRRGHVVMPPQFADAGDFFSGLAAVRVGDLWGYLSTSGKMAFPTRYDSAGDFDQNAQS
jgi:WG containing repeat